MTFSLAGAVGSLLLLTAGQWVQRLYRQARAEQVRTPSPARRYLWHAICGRSRHYLPPCRGHEAVTVCDLLNDLVNAAVGVELALAAGLSGPAPAAVGPGRLSVP